MIKDLCTLPAKQQTSAEVQPLVLSASVLWNSIHASNYTILDAGAYSMSFENQVEYGGAKVTARKNILNCLNLRCRGSPAFELGAK